MGTFKIKKRKAIMNNKLMKITLLITAIVFIIISCNSKKSAPENIEADEVTETGEVIETGGILISFSYVDESGLKKYDAYDSFIENEEHSKIAFTSNVPVKDFSWLAIVFSDEGHDERYRIDEELYSLKELDPQKPFVVSWQEIGIFAHRGFTYRDENGQRQYYALHEGNYGMDPAEYNGPALVVEQFFPMRIVPGKYEYTDDETTLLLYLEETSYTFHVNDTVYEGTAVIDFGQDGQLYVTLDGIKWAHNWMENFTSITDYGDLDNIDWDKMKDEETYGVELWMEESEEGKELVFQNHGNPMAPYVIFEEIGDKFVNLQKAP